MLRQSKRHTMKGRFKGFSSLSFLILLALFCHPSRREPIDIDIWYGQHQTFGHLGQSQKWINILGNISSVDSIVTFYAVINKTDTMQLSIGQDCCRLARQGDFNIDIPRNRLKTGENKILISAKSLSGYRTSRVVIVRLETGNTWPLPYEIHWADVKEITDVVEIMDGKWALTSEGIRTVEPYYDRILTFGDSTWRDYEVQTTIIFHDFTTPAPGPPTFNVSHAAIASRFPGHDIDEHQPHRQWFPLGATSEFRLTAALDSCRWRIFDGENLYVEDNNADKLRAIELNKVYGMKHRIITLPDGRTQYSVKLWPHEGSEPREWDLVALEPAGNIPNGAALLIAHNTDVTFGDVRISPCY